MTGTLAGSLGVINPFRYRGYVYDEETGLYYLRSRYYNLKIGRFLNSDSLILKNLFSYCHNAPVNNIDGTGKSSITLTKDVTDSSVSWDDEFMPVDTFVDLLIQAVTDPKWIYTYGHSLYRDTDCVGLIKYILNWYYSYKSFKKFSKIEKGPNKGQIYNQVIDLSLYGTQYGETYEITDPDSIPIGAAVFVYDPNHPRANEQNKGWIHVGIYIGKTDQYEHSVAAAQSRKDGVGIFELTEDYTRYALLEGVDYR